MPSWSLCLRPSPVCWRYLIGADVQCTCKQSLLSLSHRPYEYSAQTTIKYLSICFYNRNLNALVKHPTRFETDYNINAFLTSAGRTCKIFNDRLMSPVDRVTMAFMPSGVISMLKEMHRKHRQTKFTEFFMSLRWHVDYSAFTLWGPIHPLLSRTRNTQYNWNGVFKNFSACFFM